MDRWEYKIMGSQRAEARRVVMQAVERAPDGTMFVFDPPGASRLQQKKYHAMIADIARTCTLNGRSYAAKSWKRFLVEAFVGIMNDDARGRGDPAPFRGDAELDEGIDGEIVALGVQSRRFTREQAINFIEYLFHYGADNDVVWSEKSKAVIRELVDQRDPETPDRRQVDRRSPGKVNSAP